MKNKLKILKLKIEYVFLKLKILKKFWWIIPKLSLLQPFDSLCLDCGQEIHLDSLFVVQVSETQDEKLFWTFAPYICKGCGKPIGIIKQPLLIDVTSELIAMREKINK